MAARCATRFLQPAAVGKGAPWMRFGWNAAEKVLSFVSPANNGCADQTSGEQDDAPGALRAPWTVVLRAVRLYYPYTYASIS